MNQELLSEIVPDGLEEHLPDLVRFARSLARNAEWADDIAQESMVRALQRDTELPAIANPRGWLFQIAANVFREWWRRQARESSMVERIAVQASERKPEVPVEVAEQRERLVAIWSFIQTLPDVQRRILVANVLEGQSHQQIAEQLGTSKDNVKANLFAARKKLREKFMEAGEPETLQMKKGHDNEP